MHHHSTKTKVFVLESKSIKHFGKSPVYIRLCIDGLWLQLKHEGVMEWGGIM